MLVHLQNQYWKVKPPAALKIISKDYESGVLKMYDDTLTELKSKHPTATEVKEDSLLFGAINKLSQSLFQQKLLPLENVQEVHLIFTLISFVICY